MYSPNKNYLQLIWPDGKTFIDVIQNRDGKTTKPRYFFREKVRVVDYSSLRSSERREKAATVIQRAFRRLLKTNLIYHHYFEELHLGVTASELLENINNNTRRILKNLKGFIRARDRLDNVAKGCSCDKNFLNEFPSFEKPTEQQDLQGLRCSTMKSLMDVAERASIIFTDLLNEIVKQVGLTGNRTVAYKGKAVMIAPFIPCSVLVIAPLKSKERSLEKVMNEYGGDWSKLFDVVRCSIVVDDAEALQRVVALLCGTSDPRSFFTCTGR